MPLSDVSISIGTVASRVFLSDQLCHVALILQILKAGNVLYQLYPLLMHYESCIRWWHTQTKMKIRELTLREKQAICWGDSLTIYCPQETLTLNYRRYTARCKPLTSTKNRKARLEFVKNTKVNQKSFGTVFMDRWDKDEPLSKWWESKACGEKKGTAKDPKHTASSVKHGGGVVMAVSGGPLRITDDLMYDDSSRINLKGYKTILPTNIQEKATGFIGKCFILHQDNDPKHAASSVKEFIRAKKGKVLDCQ